MNNYDDIINLDYSKIKKKNGMPISSRAAIFSPFAALTGYDDAIEETVRITENEIYIDEDYKEIINSKLINIEKNIKSNPEIEITYFIKDNKKAGGKYIDKLIKVKRIDLINNIIISTNNERININNIVDIKEK